MKTTKKLPPRRTEQKEAEFMDEIQTKVSRVFLLAIHSHLYSSALRFLFPQTHTTSYSFYSSVTVHYKGERRKTFPMVKEIYTETSSLRTLKSMTINLKEIVRSWIRLQNSQTVKT
jgi:hypothetical protein